MNESYEELNEDLMADLTDAMLFDSTKLRLPWLKAEFGFDIPITVRRNCPNRGKPLMVVRIFIKNHIMGPPHYWLFSQVFEIVDSVYTEVFNNTAIDTTVRYRYRGEGGSADGYWVIEAKVNDFLPS